MNIQDVRTLLDYHYWARDRMLAAVEALTEEEFKRQMGSSFSSVQDTLGHAYSAEWAWHQRFTGTSPASQLPSSTFPDVATVRQMWLKTESEVRGFVERLGELGLQGTIDYKTLAGDERTSVYWHLLQHIVNHASYHRGQITTLLRQLGHKPPQSTDMVRFYWERT